MERNSVTTSVNNNVVNHHERILDRILKKNFIGAVVVSKDILPSKINLFDVTCDISRQEVDNEHDKFFMDYGECIHEFDVSYKARDVGGSMQYVVSTIS